MTIDTVAGWIRDAAPRSVTVLTGAGVSTDSGIPDFRGPSGVWTRDPGAQALFTLANYVADPAVRRRAWRSRLEHPAWTARPNAAHRALAAFERSGRLRALVTQNIDGLHQAAGSTDVVEVHGTLFEAECLGACGRRLPMTEVLDRVRAGEEDPACLSCGGLLKSATISFGQSLDPDVWRRAVEVASGCSVFLAAGTSLSVQPVAGLARAAVGTGARLVVVNAEPTPYDGLAAAVLRIPTSESLPAVLGT